MSHKNEIDPRIKVGCYVRFYALVHFWAKNNETTRKYKNLDNPKFKTKSMKRLLGTVESINHENGTAVIVNSNLGERIGHKSDSKFNRKLSELKFYS